MVFTACSSSDDNNAPEVIKNALYGKSFSNYEEYGEEGINTDSTELNKFRNCLNMVNWNIITPKPVVTNVYTKSTETVVKGIRHDVSITFTDNQNCIITNTYTRDTADVDVTKHYYECAFNKWEQGYGTSQGEVRITITAFTCYGNNFVLGNYKYFQTVYKIGETLKSGKSSQMESLNCSYTLKDDNSIYIKDKKTSKEYSGSIIRNGIKIEKIFVGEDKYLSVK